MNRQRLLELAGIELNETGLAVDEQRYRTVVRRAIEEVLDLVDLEDGGESLSIAINKIVDKAAADMED